MVGSRASLAFRATRAGITFDTFGERAYLGLLLMRRIFTWFQRLFFLSSVLTSVEGADILISANEGALQVKGLTWLDTPAPSSYRTLSGPTPDIVGFGSSGEPLLLRGRLGEVVKESGSLMFWFATDRAYRSGRNTPALVQKLVEVPDTLAVSFIAEPSSVTVRVEWGGPLDEVFTHHIRIILPELPGPAWHHFALSWSRPDNEINAFLDGTPYYVPGEKTAPLNLLTGRELVLHLNAFALADVRVSPNPLTAKALSQLLPMASRGHMDRLLGATVLGLLSAEGMRGKTLYACKFATAADTVGWVLEGPGAIAYQDGWMQMKSQRPTGPEGHFVYWCPEVFPDSFVAEWEFELLEEKGLCILFFAACGKDGLDLFDSRLAPRAGIFGQYTQGDIDCYHISYFANNPGEPRQVANLRKNRGFYLVANGPVGVATFHPGEVHRALLIKDGAHIRMAVDGRLIIDYLDDGQRAGPAYTEGRIGFRQMQSTSAHYRNFRVSALK